MALVEREVRPKLRADHHNLIVFPEYAGLPCCFIGERGKAARMQTTVEAAYHELFLAYLQPASQSPIGYYLERWPNLSPNEMVSLSLTDTVWRAFCQTLREIAVALNSWVIASTNISGQIERSKDRTDIAALSDPSLTGCASVYVARDLRVFNTAFVFSPDGNIISSVRKSYLVPTEESELRLSYGALSDIAPVDLGFARLGIVTSKDAWMPDVLDRLATLDVNVLIQPEAFEGWAPADCDSHAGWPPDNFQQSGWMAVQKYAAFRYCAIPHLTGNLMDAVFDGQSAIICKAVPGKTRNAYVGQTPQAGFKTVAPWVVADPGESGTTFTIEARRDALRTVGESLLPGTSRQNDYVETAIAATIHPVRRFPKSKAGVPGVLGVSRPVAPSRLGEQSYAKVACDDDGCAMAVWQDTRDGRSQILAACFRDTNRRFGPAFRVASSPNPQRTPAICITTRSVYVAWQEDIGLERRILVSRANRHNLAFGPAVSLGTPSPVNEWLPTLAATAASTGHHSIFLAFVGTHNGNERIYVARTYDATMDWAVSPVDPSPMTHPAPNPRNNQWAPSIANHGNEVAVAWVGFRDFSWDVFVSRSTDGGRTFSSPKRVDDAPSRYERIHSDPALLFLRDGTLLCGWSDMREQRLPSRVRVARGTPGFSKGRFLTNKAGPDDNSWRLDVAGRHDSERVAAVWQDYRNETNHIYMALSRDAGATFAEEQRVDDGDDARNSQYAPQVAAIDAERVLVLWEDTRSGQRRIRYATGPASYQVRDRASVARADQISLRFKRSYN